MGLIIPGGWEEFFRFIGEPYTGQGGPMFPTNDKRNPMEVLVPKLMAAVEKFDMIPKRDHEGAEPIVCPESDSSLPGKAEPFFLKADKGPRFAAAGLLIKPLVRPQQSDGKFAIAKFEGSSTIETSLSEHALSFASSHHAFLIDQGTFEFKIGGETSTVGYGETVFVPAGIAFSLEVTSVYGAAYVFTNGGGIVETLVGAGQPYANPVISEDFPTDFDPEALGQGDGLTVKALTNGSS